MSKYKKIGVVIADRDEYEPLEKLAEKYSAVKYCGLKREGITFNFCGSEVICVYCGIGKVNAAAASMHLIDNGCELIFNYGLSGGISGVDRFGIVLPEKFIEHDFDLTPLGYKPCEKPGQNYIYNASGVREAIKSVFPNAIGGTAVCGDRFICSESDSRFFAENFGATSCDMETAAIASVCDMTDIEFVSIRRVSDSADESACESYTDMNTNDGASLAELFMKALTAVCQNGGNNG